MYRERAIISREDQDALVESVWLVFQNTDHDLHYILYNMKGFEIQALSKNFKKKKENIVSNNKGVCDE